MPRLTRSARASPLSRVQPSSRDALRLAHALGIDRPGGGSQHKRPQLARAAQGVLHRRPAAHRLGDDADIGQLQMLDQRREIVGIVGGVGAAGNGGRRREAAMREGHAGVAGREVRDLLPPRHVVAAEPMREQQRRPAARHLVVDRAVRPFQFPDATNGASAPGVLMLVPWRASARASSTTARWRRRDARRRCCSRPWRRGCCGPRAARRHGWRLPAARTCSRQAP